MLAGETWKDGRRFVDGHVVRFGQGINGLLLLGAFLADLWWGVLGVAFLVALAALGGPRANLWGLLYRRVLRPLLRIPVPDRLRDGAASRFANFAAGMILLLASAALVWGSPWWVAAAGWALALVVAASALLAAAADLCVACEVYVRLWGGRPAPLG